MTAPTHAPSDTAGYRILAPDSGVTWREGETHLIRWRNLRGDSVNLGVAMGGKDRGHLAMALPPAADSFSWEIPRGFITGFGPARSDAVRIRVESTGDPRIGSTSPPFTIAGP